MLNVATRNLLLPQLVREHTICGKKINAKEFMRTKKSKVQRKILGHGGEK